MQVRTDYRLMKGKLFIDSKEILLSAINAVKGQVCVKNNLKREGNLLIIEKEVINLQEFSKLIIVGGGKAVASMAKGLEEILSDKITEGIISVKYGHREELSRIKINEAAHPVPDFNGMRGALEIVRLVSQANDDSLIIVLISGGGSALLPLPEEGISLEDKQDTTEQLLRCGASINEINIIRKHISMIKGGKLAYAAYPARVLSLIISDVVGDKLSDIASGPTSVDDTTFEECKEIINKYNLYNKLPKSVIDHIEKGLNGRASETIKSDSCAFKKVSNVIIGNNVIALKAAEAKAKELGYKVEIISSDLQYDVETAADIYSRLIGEGVKRAYSDGKNYCYLAGGEIVVKIKGRGKGGRNMHLALALLTRVKDLNGYLFGAVGTDGTDGPTNAAGAFIDSFTYDKSIKLNIDYLKYLENYNSYNFFKRTDNLIITGPTGTNVMDLHILLISPRIN